MEYKVEPLPNSQGLLGEGPHWDIEKQSLYFVDIENAQVLRYDYAQNKTYRCQIENEKLASFIIPIEGAINKFVVGIGRRISIITWDGISETCKLEKDIITVEQGDSNCIYNRFNDGKCDPRGRLFAGTMHTDISHFDKRTGNFYKMDEDCKYKLLLEKIGISNGLAWNEKNNKFYYIDSLDYKVREYDYDFNTGCFKNPREVFNLDSLQKEGKKILPDGMTSDSEGFLYVALFGGSSVLKIDPKDGKVVLDIKIPCELVTSAAFGGPNLDILYVTTSGLLNKPSPAGTTYKVTGIGAKGLAMAKCKLAL
ncbi:regucalcin-like [Episyrphus balteatus]|uniref:regucalcin-like n=1 Tax=Episyrphus balteatus TaxID=286459 RepID=UPI0024862531|nr:regucalcin-like [Episyrphus balteatus]